MPGAIVVATVGLKSLVTKYEITWVSDVAGDVSGSTFNMKQGTIVAVEFVPSVGALQPNDAYDIDLWDAASTPMFDNGGGTSIGSNLSNVFSSYSVPLVGLTGVTMLRRWHHGGPVQPLVANAGDTNAGTINVYVMDGVA